MELKGSNFHDIEFHMQRAKELGLENDPIKIYLRVTGGDKSEYLGNTYEAKTLEYMPLISLLTVEVPVKNLRKLVEDECVVKYGWPGVVEVLAH